MMRGIKGIRRVILYVIIIINLVVIVGCSNKEDENDSVGSGPTIEDMSQDNNDKTNDKIIEDAIAMSEKIIKSLNDVEIIEMASVFINHEAVLVAVKLESESQLTTELRLEIEDKVYGLYPEAKTIAISNDEYVYEAISRLLKSYKENDPLKELLKDLQEILQDTL